MKEIPQKSLICTSKAEIVMTIYIVKENLYLAHCMRLLFYVRRIVDFLFTVHIM